MISQVKKFQLDEGLVPDGIVGTQTLIHLNTVVDGEVPLLINKQEDE
jgi:general secretion pathway protein A